MPTPLAVDAVTASPLSRRATRQALRTIATFVVRNGGFATAVIERVGPHAARIVLIGVNGTWGDQVLPSVAAAQRICRLAGVDVAQSWSQELAARMDLA